MKRNATLKIAFLSIMSILLLVACGPSQAELDATATKEEADKFATQTAKAPTATPKPTITPTPKPEPMDVLEASIAALEEAGSYHFDMEAQMNIKEEGFSLDIPLTYVGDFQSPDRMIATMIVSLMGITVESEMIGIGEMMYIMDPITGEWQVMTEGDAPLDPTIFMEIPPSGLADLSIVGEETIGGDRVYHLIGSFKEEELGEIGGELQVEYWIGIEDSLLRKMYLEGEMEVSGEGFLTEDITGGISLAVTMNLSDFGKTVVIEIPEMKPTPTPIDSPFGLMSVYESSQLPFTFIYPADWVMGEPELGETARFISEQGGILVITEEDLISSGLGELTLEEYGDIIYSMVSTSPDFKLVARTQFTTENGLSGEVLAFSIQAGILEVRRFYYVHNNRLAFNATYIVQSDMIDVMEPLFTFSFNTLQVTD